MSVKAAVQAMLAELETQRLAMSPEDYERKKADLEELLRLPEATVDDARLDRFDAGKMVRVDVPDKKT